jgi:3-deoxy-D-manno-octulosonic-acid transferase
LYLFLYNIFLLLYTSGVRISAIWNTKARKWLKGRQGIFERLQNTAGPRRSPAVWVHCASLGEFEQGRPLLEAIRARYPETKIFLSFFSPSGFEVREHYAGADLVFYLPIDSRKNARRLLDILQPSLVLFVKYELWYYYLAEIRKRGLPCLLVSAVFHPGQSFFKWFGTLQRKMLGLFTYIFVQDLASRRLLGSLGVACASVSGDTRFDAVSNTAAAFAPIPAVETFLQDVHCLVAGSTWADDEVCLAAILPELEKRSMRLIIAPHEVTQSHLAELSRLFPDAIYLSKISDKPSPPGKSASTKATVLVIDSVGLLSKLYRYAAMTYVGGGFTRDGVHNVLEAAVYGKPIVFGKNYGKYREAVDLVERKAAAAFSNAAELQGILAAWLDDGGIYRRAAEEASAYVAANRGATKKIMDYMEMNRLLTS